MDAYQKASRTPNCSSRGLFALRIRPKVGFGDLPPKLESRRILDLHRGTIRLDSSATTIGLQVTIALPRVVG